MKIRFITFVQRLLTVLLLALLCAVSVSQAAVVKVKIQDVSGKPVEGVKVFFYESSNVRKPADFISSPSDKNGDVLATVPAGKYWTVARLKKDSLYGPLMPGDKHSGEPVEVVCSDADTNEVNYEVSDLREIGQKKRTGTNDIIRLWGRVLDKEGNTVAGAYVYAGRTRDVEPVPEYLSAWTDEDGNYAIYLPSGGVFFVGSSKQFPLSAKPLELKQFDFGAADLDIATDIQLIVY